MGSYGALGATFQLARLFQFCSLIAIIGMVAKFIAVMVNADATPPSILIGTISVVCRDIPFPGLPTLANSSDLHCRHLLYNHDNPFYR